MTEQVSGKLPIEPDKQRVRSRQDAPTTPEEIEGMAAHNALPDAEAVTRLAAAAAEAFEAVSAAMIELTVFFSKIGAIGHRLGADLEKRIGEISDGAEDDTRSAG